MPEPRTGVYIRIHEDSTGPAHRHGAYVQDVRYADFAGAKNGDAVLAGKALLLDRQKRIAAQVSLLLFLFSLFLQGDNARAPLAAITTWIIRKNASSEVILPAPWDTWTSPKNPS